MSIVAVNRKTIGDVETGVRAKRRSKARARAVSYVVNRSIAFLSVLLVSYLATNIAGHILIDQARRDAATAKTRFTTASRAAAGLESRVRDLKSTASIETWAVANGYTQRELLPGLEAPEGRTVVAQR